MRLTTMRSVAMLSTCTLAAACTTYTPVPVTSALNDQNARVRLTQQGMIDLGPLLGGGASELEGRIVSANDSTLTISVTSLTRLTGVEETWNGEQTKIALTDVSAVEREQSAVARSIVGAGILVGGVYLIGRSLGSGDATGSHTTTGGSVK